MNVNQLVPRPSKRDSFHRRRCRFVPESPACYVLTTFTNVVLYIGLTVNLRRRINEHLDSPEKTTETRFGRAVFFYWFETSDIRINKVERTWLNIHIQHEGVVPVLNSIYSPVSA